MRLQTSRVRTPAVPRSALAPADLASAHACTAEVRTCLQTSPPAPADLCGALASLQTSPLAPTKWVHLMSTSARAAVRPSARRCARLHKTTDVCCPRCRRRQRAQLSSVLPTFVGWSRRLHSGWRCYTPPCCARSALRPWTVRPSAPRPSPLRPCAPSGPRHSGRAYPPALATPAVRTLRPSVAWMSARGRTCADIQTPAVCTPAVRTPDVRRGDSRSADVCIWGRPYRRPFSGSPHSVGQDSGRPACSSRESARPEPGRLHATDIPPASVASVHGPSPAVRTLQSSVLRLPGVPSSVLQTCGQLRPSAMRTLWRTDGRSTDVPHRRTDACTKGALGFEPATLGS